MISENKLYLILDDLHKHNRNKDDLIIHYINNRLNKSIISYNKELEDYSHMLLNNNSMFLLKRLK